MTIIALLAGLAALWLGAEWLVRGAARLAFALGVRPLIIGITVVGFGTSAPEVAVSAQAAWRGQTDVALGNVLGSNIANSGLILAIAALLMPKRIELSLLKREGPIMVGVSALVWAFGWTGAYARWHGALLLAGLVVFLALSLRWAREERPEVEAGFEAHQLQRRLRERGARARQVALIVVGLAVLTVGGHLLVGSAVELARRFGVAEIVIASTLVAVGTSLPELATTLVAAVRRQADISVGNIVGSNLFNLLCVLGLSASIRPIPVVPLVRDFELLWMFAFAVATAVILRTGRRLYRLEGVTLLAAYAVFLLLLFD
jgi:cation:H+ antiporter